MPIARIAHAGGTSFASVEAEGFALLAGYGDPLSPLLGSTGKVIGYDDARLLSPVAPRTVVGMAHNTGPADRKLAPQAFLKPVSSVSGPGSLVPLPDGVGLVEAEAELAVVVGRTARHVSVEDALDHVLGVTVANDVTARDLQRTDPLWFAAKSGDGWTPLGPWVVTLAELAAGGLRVDDLTVRLNVDGVDQRPASTTGLARSVAECLAYVSSVLTLEPGDVLLTGAPGQTAAIVPGSRVTASVDGVGELHSVVVAASSATPASAARRQDSALRQDSEAVA